MSTKSDAFQHKIRYNKQMDLEKLTHSGYRVSVVTAIVLSCMVVTLASLLGRSALNLRGALVLDEPTDVTIIALVEPRLEEDTSIAGINFLRKEDVTASSKPFYAYHVVLSDGENYLVRIGFDAEDERWILMHYEHLRTAATERAPE